MRKLNRTALNRLVESASKIYTKSKRKKDIITCVAEAMGIVYLSVDENKELFKNVCKKLGKHGGKAARKKTSSTKKVVKKPNHIPPPHGVTYPNHPEFEFVKDL